MRAAALAPICAPLLREDWLSPARLEARSAAVATAAVSELEPTWADLVAARCMATETNPRTGTPTGMGVAVSTYTVRNTMPSQSSTTCGLSVEARAADAAADSRP